MKPAAYQTTKQPTWCPGCGNFGLLTALRQALADLKIKPSKLFAAYGIGCSGNGANFIRSYGFHSLHGRTLPIATATKLANHKLTVLAIGGDGDGYGIGLGHFIHSCRRNHDVTYIVHNNQTYGLTTGQTSPTADKGMKTKSTPFGAIELPINPLALSLNADATFVARGFAGDVGHLTWLFKESIKHTGFAHIDVLQPCVTFNKVNTFDWFKERVYRLEDTKYDARDPRQALEKVHEWGDKIPIGIFYRTRRKTYEEYLPQIEKKPLVKQDVEKVDVGKVLKTWM